MAIADADAVRRYRERREKRLSARFDFNDAHDKLGRFAPKVGGATKTAEEMGKEDIKVGGPRDSRRFVQEYYKQHPSVRDEAKKYLGVRSEVMNFVENHPEAENYNTYDAVTGKKLNIDNGYCVTFHQNDSADDPYGGYSDEDYADMCAVAKDILGADSVNIGYFGNPEISFVCKDYQLAKRFCIEHNQNSIYDAKTGKLWRNDLWDENKNPIKGEGSH